MGLGITLLYRARHLRPVLNFRGIKVPVTGAHVSRTVWKHLFKGGYERPEIDGLLALGRPGDTVLELGTGMGIVSGVAAKAFPDMTIHAYEANPALIEPITRLHEMNGITNVHLSNAVLLPAPTQTSIAFNLHDNFTESSISDKITSARSVYVPVEDINAVIARTAPDIFVCDIEGAEDVVFDGLDLSGLRVVLLELHPTIIDRAAIKRVYDTCAAAGLYPRIEHSDLQVVAFERID